MLTFWILKWNLSFFCLPELFRSKYLLTYLANSRIYHLNSGCVRTLKVPVLKNILIIFLMFCFPQKLQVLTTALHYVNSYYLFLQRAIRKSTTFKLYRMPLLPAAYHCDENNSTYKYKHITIVAKKKNTEHTHRFKNYVNVVSTSDALQKW